MNIIDDCRVPQSRLSQFGKVVAETAMWSGIAAVIAAIAAAIFGYSIIGSAIEAAVYVVAYRVVSWGVHELFNRLFREKKSDVYI